MSSPIPAMVLVLGAIVLGVVLFPSLYGSVEVSDELTPDEQTNFENVNDVSVGLFAFWPVFALIGAVILIVIVFLRLGR